jgi:hypothetical protein
MHARLCRRLGRGERWFLDLSGCLGWLSSVDGWCVQFGHGGFGQVAAVADLPLFVGLDEHGADETGDGLRVGEDPDHVGSALDLTVEPLD